MLLRSYRSRELRRERTGLASLAGRLTHKNAAAWCLQSCVHFYQQHRIHNLSAAQKPQYHHTCPFTPYQEDGLVPRGGVEAGGRGSGRTRHLEAGAAREGREVDVAVPQLLGRERGGVALVPVCFGRGMWSL